MHISHNTSQLEAAIMAQRSRLVRLCAQLTDNSDDAEDLAQETLLEAWRHLHTLREPTAYIAWLNGIARNVCLRWHRRQRQAPVQLDPDWSETDAFDLEFQLERDELAALLDRALALLPPQTRAVLIQKYIEESPQIEIAARLGISEGAVAMRLQRGKLALRRMLSNELRDQAMIYEQSAGDGACWQQTNRWCPHCGQQRLLMSLPTSATPEFRLRCPDCTSPVGAYFVKVNWHTPSSSLRSRRALLDGVLTWTNDFFRARLRQGCLHCARCDKTVALQPCLASNDMPTPGLPIVGAEHVGCCPPHWAYSTEMALYLPEGQRF